MSDSVLVEASDERRRDFAVWCLAQEPRLETASAFGTEVPAELFKVMPEYLLVGAYVDGRPYRHTAHQDSDGNAVPGAYGDTLEEAEKAPVAPRAAATRRRKAGAQ